MKNTILSLVVCAVSFTLTYFGLNEYGTPYLLEKTPKEETVIPTNNEESLNEVITNNSSDAENVEEPIEEKKEYNIIGNIAELEKNYKNWLAYNKKNIELSLDFTPIDVDNSQIEKEDFLSKLKTGLYIPLKTKEDNVTYKLFKLSDKADKKIGKSERSTATVAYAYYKKEGTVFPNYSWTDLNGNEYTSSSGKGKFKVIKCWFINCVVCVQEFPELNKLYDDYEGNEQVEFISLAFDKGEKLKKFLIKKEFRFPVIPEQKKFMNNELEIKRYPTHIIIDEENNIVKMVDNVAALTTILNQLIDEEDLDFNEEGNDEDIDF